MNEINWLLYWIKYFLVHSTGEYLVNTIIYEGLGYKKYKLYKYYKVLSLFRIVICINETDSLGKGNYKMQRWLFDYHDKIILRQYYK